MRALYRVWTSALAADSVGRPRCAAERQGKPDLHHGCGSRRGPVRNHHQPDQSWIADLLSTYVGQANREDFQLDLDGGIETAHAYAGHEGSGWHHDVDWEQTQRGTVSSRSPFS